MSTPRPLNERPLNERKIRDRALVLPVVGLLLLMPPLAGIFQLEWRIAGVPFTAIYLFVVWAVLVGAARAQARELTKLDREVQGFDRRARARESSRDEPARGS